MLWGLSELENTGMSIEGLKRLTPIQPLQLALNSYLMSRPRSKPTLKVVPMITSAPSESTHFDSLKIEISNEWVDQALISKSSRKEDKAPTPSSLWDKRILLSFSNRSGVGQLIKVLRSFLLRIYRRRLFRSLITHLRTSYAMEWDAYCNGFRCYAIGGDFDKSLVAGRDMLMKIGDASWFEWLGGSTLIFWKWHAFNQEARDRFPMFLLVDNIEELGFKVSKPSPSADPRLRNLYNEKLIRLIKTRHIESGFVR